MTDHCSSVARSNRAAKSSVEGSKHTPGPWEFEAGFLITRAYAGGVGNPLFLVTAITGEPDEIAANEALIAAAPDLLEALTELAASYAGVCSNLPFGVMGRSEIAADLAPARAAIAKATSPADAASPSAATDRTS